MRILMVTPVHPATPHISGVRAWRFACRLAQRGHRVVLLTGGTGGTDAAQGDLEYHDWSRPCVVALPFASPRGAGGGNIAAKARTVVSMLRHGGRSGDWVRQAVRTALGRLGGFHPDVVWCTFGMLEAVVAARRIARRIRRPWVLDVKDNWELYVPGGLRRVMAWRIGGFAEAIANAELTADMTSKWLRRPAQVLYSGVDAEFLATADEPAPPASFAINLVGSTYFPGELARFVAGIVAWLATLDHRDRAQVTLRYLGGDVQAVATATARLSSDVTVELAGYRPAAELADHCRRAAINAYIAHPATFHHKLLELLACRRPVLAFPSERREAIDLAARAGGRLVVADSEAALARALTDAHAEWKAGRIPMPPSCDLGRYSWPAQTMQLEQILTRVATRSSRDT